MGAIRYNGSTGTLHRSTLAVLWVILGVVAALAADNGQLPPNSKGLPGGVYPGFSGPYPGPNQRLAPDSASDYIQALGWIKTNARKLDKVRGAKHPEIRGYLVQIQADAQFLQQRWMEWPIRNPGKNPYLVSPQLDPYYRSLKGNYQLLDSVKKESPERVLESVKAVADDIRIKAENCRHSNDGLGRALQVTVRTLGETNEVGGFTVWCSPIALVGSTNEHIRFPKMSSPAVHKNLPPGRYAMWLTKDRQSSPRVPQSIGGQGQTLVEIDLPAEFPETP